MKKTFLVIIICLLVPALYADDLSLYIEGGGGIGAVFNSGAGDKMAVDWLNSVDFGGLDGYIHGAILKPEADILVAGIFSPDKIKNWGFFGRYIYSSANCHDYLYDTSYDNILKHVSLDSVTDGHYIGLGGRKYLMKEFYIQADAGVDFIAGSSEINIKPYAVGVDEIYETADFSGAVFGTRLEAGYEWPGGPGHGLKVCAGFNLDTGRLRREWVRQNITQSTIEYLSGNMDYFSVGMFIKAGIVLDINSMLPQKATPPFPKASDMVTPKAPEKPKETATPQAKKKTVKDKPKPSAKKTPTKTR